MGYFFNTSDINQTFIIEPLSITGGSPTLTACTALYTNAVVSCSGDTQIFMGTGVITFNGDLYTNNDLTADVINASTYYSGGTNLFDIIDSKNITGGTFNNNTDTLSLYKTNGSVINVTGFTDYYTTGATVIGTTAYFDRNDKLSAYTLNLAAFTANTFVTGVTFSNNQLIIVKNDGTSISTFINTFTGLTVTGLLKSNSISATTISANTISATKYIGLPIDVYVTGGTYSNGVSTFTNITGGTFDVSGYTTPFTGGTVTGDTIFTNGLTASTFSATTYLGLPIDYDNYLSLSGGTVSGATSFTDGLTANTFSATTYYGLPLDIHTTAFTFNPATYDITIKGNDGVDYTQNLGILATDMTITGGTYNINTGVVTFTNNTGGTFSVTGFTSGMTDSFTVSANLSGETIQFNNNLQGPNFYNVSLSPILKNYLPLSGGNVSGNTSILGTFRVTGNTITAGNLTSLGGSSTYTATPLANNPGTYDRFLEKYYVKLHPEGANNFIPYFINDIGYITLRGGSVTSNYSGITQAQIETLFDGSPKYASFNPSLLGTGMTLNISFGKTFSFTNTLAISFGSTAWRAQDFIIELTSGGTYTTLDVKSGYTDSDYLIEFATNATSFDGIRLTFSNFYNTSSPTGFRIADISLVNFNSDGPKTLYVGRDGGEIYKQLYVTGATQTRPAYSTLNDVDTGMYFPTANTIGFSTNGVERLRITDTETTVNAFSATSISATTYYNLPQDVYVTGSSFNTSSKTLRNTRNDNTNIDVILPVRTFLTAATTTINSTLQTIDTITGITDNSNVFIVSYLNAYKDSVDYGFWKRTLAVNKISGLVSVIGENSDFDRVSSGMTANSVIYSANSGNISIRVSGETAKSYTWKSNWEIIK